MNRETNKPIVVGNIKFRIEFRKSPWDSGAVIRVFSKEGNEERQALKFDPFIHNPHYHLDPDGRDIIRQIDVTQPLEWTLQAISERLGEFLVEAGYKNAADGIDGQDIRRAIGRVTEVIASLS